VGEEFVQRGRELVQQNLLAQAVEVCRNGLLAEPSAFEGRLVLGAALMGLGRYDEVVREMQLALTREGDHPQALALKGEALMNIGDHGTAGVFLARARALAPANPLIQSLYDEAMTRAANAPESVPPPREGTVNLDQEDISVVEIRDQTPPASTNSIALSEQDLMPLTGEASDPALELSAADIMTVESDTETAAPAEDPAPAPLWSEPGASAGRVAPSGKSSPAIGQSAVDAPPGRYVGPGGGGDGALPTTAMGNPAEHLDELFPDDERGVSRMADLG